MITGHTKNKSQSMKSVYKKPNDQFWKNCLMKVLAAMYHEECTWASDQWQKYGISNADKGKIEEAFKLNQKSVENKKDQ